MAEKIETRHFPMRRNGISGYRVNPFPSNCITWAGHSLSSWLHLLYFEGGNFDVCFSLVQDITVVHHRNWKILINIEVISQMARSCRAGWTAKSRMLVNPAGLRMSKLPIFFAYLTTYMWGGKLLTVRSLLRINIVRRDCSSQCRRVLMNFVLSAKLAPYSLSPEPIKLP